LAQKKAAKEKAKVYEGKIKRKMPIDQKMKTQLFFKQF